MKRVALLAALLLTSFAAMAQEKTNAGAGSAKPAAPVQQKRAPLATPDDLEPAVDVGAQRVALIDRPANPAAAAAAPAPDSLAAPGSSVPPADDAAKKTGAPAAQASAPAAAPGAAPAAKAPNSRVMDSLDLGTTSITGNQELPKVLYIVPWKKSDLGDLVGRPVNTLLDEVLEPVDPEVFERHLNYYEALYGKGHKEKE
jgi:hypothetical protein